MLRPAAPAIAAADDVGEIHRLAGEFADFLSRGGHGSRQFGVSPRIPFLLHPVGGRVGPPHAGEHGHQRVVVSLRHRVELVIVAAGTVDRYAAGGGHHLGDHVVEIVGPGLPPQHLALRLDLTDEVPGAGREKAGGRDPFGIVGRDDVAGDLAAQELVVGHVGIDRTDHPVAIPPGVRPQLITLEAMRVGVVGDVEPVAGPTLAVVCRREEAVEELFVGIGGMVGNERGHLVGSRRQPEQIKRQPANERATVGLGGRCEVFRGERGPHKAIDLVADGPDRLCRRGWLFRRNGRPHHRLPGPMVESGVAIGFKGQTVGLRLGPRGAGVDPLLEEGDLDGREPIPIGGHHLLFVVGCDPVDELTFARLARKDHRAEVPSLQCPVLHVEPQAALLRVDAVALATPLHEQGADLPLKIDVGGHSRRRCSQQGRHKYRPYK